MKVLQIYKDYYPPVKGGIEGHINLLARGLKDRGIEVEVLVSNTGPRLVRENINGITVTKVPQVCRLASAPLNMTFPFWLRRLGRDADLLHFHFPNPTAEISYLLSGLESDVVVSYHSDIVRQERLGKLYSPFLIKFLKKARTIIATSPNYVRSSKLLTEFHSKCKVVPLGIDLSRFVSRPESSGKIATLRKTYGTSIVLFIGRFRYYKGLHVLIDAMKKVNGKLLLIGAGLLENDLRSKVAAAKLEEKVFFLGELSNQEVVAHLQACDVFVLPSILRSEAFGIVQIEAMACEKPVVSTELGTGTSFANQNQKTGLVVPPNDVDALAQAVNFLLANFDIREKYGKVGHERVEKYFSMKRMVDNVVEVYKDSLIHKPFTIHNSYRVCEKASDSRKPKGKIKVLRIITRLNIGGPAIHVKLLTNGLDANKFRSTLATGTVSHREGDMNYLFDSLNNKPIIIPDLQREINFWKDLKTFRQIFNLLHQEKPDIVHTHTAKAGFSARLAVFLYNLIYGKKIKTVHTFHGHVFKSYFSRITSEMFIFIERLLSRLTNLIIAISKTQKKELVEKYRIASPDKVKKVELGFDLKPFLENKSLKGRFRRSLGIADDTLLIGIVGRLVPIKNHLMFFKVAKIFLEQNPEIRVKFIVVGDGELREELEGYCQKQGLSDHIRFCGWVKDVPSIYADLDVLAMTSLNEGTPVSIIEAMASLVPVIATNAGGIMDLLGPPDLISPTCGFIVCDRGILCRKNDPLSFAMGLKYMVMAGISEREGRIKEARSFVEKRFDQKRLIHDMESLYVQLMA